MAQPQHLPDVRDRGHETAALSAYHTDPAPRAYTSKKAKQPPSPAQTGIPDPVIEQDASRLDADRRIARILAAWKPTARDVLEQWALKPKGWGAPQGLGNAPLDDEDLRVTIAKTEQATRWVNAALARLGALSGDKWGCSGLVALLLWIYKDGNRAQDYRGPFGIDHPYPSALSSHGVAQGFLWSLAHSLALNAVNEQLSGQIPKS